MIRFQKCITGFIIAVFLAGLPVNLFARGFSGGGGFRGGGSSFSRGPSSFSSRSFSSGSASKYSGGGSKSFTTTSKPPKPSYDVSAGKARSREISQQKFSTWKNSQGIAEPKTQTFGKDLSKTRETRAQNTYGARQPTGYYTPRSTTVVIYRDPYDNTFLRYASMWWLFHHWDYVDHSRFDEAQLQNLQRQVDELKAQGNKPDSNYTEIGVDPDLAYKKDAAYNPGHTVLKFFICMVMMGFAIWLVWFIFVRKVTRR